MKKRYIFLVGGIFILNFILVSAMEHKKKPHMTPQQTLQMHCADCDRPQVECVCLYVGEPWPTETEVKKACERCEKIKCGCSTTPAVESLPALARFSALAKNAPDKETEHSQ